MIDFPNAKVNLGLHVFGKRKDGYHEILTCFYPVGWRDILEILPDPSKKTSITLTGIEIPGAPGENLCLKAYYLIKKDFDLPQIQIHLHKVIPPGGGLGGGSSDGAFILKMANRLFNILVDDELLAAYASRLGSDCPFFIYNRPMLATGRGEVLENINLDLSGKYILIVNPGIKIQTGEAYGLITPAMPELNLREILENRPIEEWKILLMNDFEKPVFSRYPALAKIKKDLYDLGAVYASLSGSGSSIYAIFAEMPVQKVVFPANYQVWGGKL